MYIKDITELGDFNMLAKISRKSVAKHCHAPAKDPYHEFHHVYSQLYFIFSQTSQCFYMYF